MSYRTIKRVLGETNLERKCRWWFGTSLFILLSLSFFWYGRRTDAIVKDLNPKFIGPELVRAGWLELHLTHLADIARMQRGPRVGGTGVAGGGQNEFEDDFYGELAKSSRELGREYKWVAILPQEGFKLPTPERYRPKDGLEEKWLAEWAKPVAPGSEAPLAGKQPEQTPATPLQVAGKGYHQRYVDDENGGRSYQYYQPIYAAKSCIDCHKFVSGGGPPGSRSAT